MQNFEPISFYIPLVLKTEDPEHYCLLIISTTKSIEKEKMLNMLADKLNPLGTVAKFIYVYAIDEGLQWVTLLNFKSSRSSFLEAISSFVKELERISVLRTYYLAFPNEEGYVVHHYLNEVRDFFGKRAALFSEENLKALFVETRKKYGNVGDKYVEIMGEFFGKTVVRKYNCKRSLNDVIRCIEHVIAEGEAKGFVHLSSLSVHQDESGYTIKIEFDKMLEEELLRDEGIEVCGSHQRGIFIGMMISMFGDDFVLSNVQQTQCISKGDPKSAFIIRIDKSLL